MIFKKSSENGITMITIVVMIVIIVILAVVTMGLSTDSIKQGVDAKNQQELTEVRRAVMARKALNLKRGIGEEYENYGFNKVKVIGAPSNFVSYDDEETTGYLVDLEYIQYGQIKLGQEYKNFESGDTITFGNDDVFIYDAENNVFYGIGFVLADGEVLYSND